MAMAHFSDFEPLNSDGLFSKLGADLSPNAKPQTSL